MVILNYAKATFFKKLKSFLLNFKRHYNSEKTNHRSFSYTAFPKNTRIALTESFYTISILFFLTLFSCFPSISSYFLIFPLSSSLQFVRHDSTVRDHKFNNYAHSTQTQTTKILDEIFVLRRLALLGLKYSMRNLGLKKNKMIQSDIARMNRKYSFFLPAILKFSWHGNKSIFRIRNFPRFNRSYEKTIFLL